MIKAVIDRDHYATRITSGNHTVIADEPKDFGGGDTGFSPTDLVAAGLAACTSITLRMYADRKQWDLTSVQVEILMEKDGSTGARRIDRAITLNGNLDEEKRTRLLDVANHCPVHKMLSTTNAISTKLA